MFLGTLTACFLLLLGGAMSDSPSATEQVTGTAKTTFVVGTILSILVAASHWINFPSW
jgi:hypothetical protein